MASAVQRGTAAPAAAAGDLPIALDDEYTSGSSINSVSTPMIVWILALICALPSRKPFCSSSIAAFNQRRQCGEVVAAGEAAGERHGDSAPIVTLLRIWEGHVRPAVALHNPGQIWCSVHH